MKGRLGGLGGRMIAAFLAIYIIWGSTYLAIQVGIETLPPFGMAATRFLIAGAILYVWARLRGAPNPTRRQWAAATLVGAALLLGGNGLVTIAEQSVPSGLAALLIATEPLWIVIMDWLRPGGRRPTAGVAVGLALGFGGLVILFSPGEALGAGVDMFGAALLVAASCSWAAGSLYGRGAPLPRDPLLNTALPMLMGGLLLAGASLATGEPAGFRPELVSLPSLLAWLYLIVFGSLVAFTAYSWLIRNAPASRVSTYAYVNPVIAVGLGWALAGEQITLRTLLAAAIIIAAVILIVTRQTHPAPTPTPAPEPAGANSEPVAGTAPAGVRR